MRGLSHKIQNIIKVRLGFSTIQGELHIKTCAEYLKNQNQTLSLFSTPCDSQMESQLSWITLSGTPIKVIVQEAQKEE